VPDQVMIIPSFTDGIAKHPAMSDRKFDLLQGEVAKRFVKELTRNLVEYNRSVGPPEEWQELVISVEADDSGALGGLAGYTHWQWLFVGHIWVKADARRQGIGAQLLANAERIARERGCFGSWLDTFSFQARDFYRRQGYEEFGSLVNYPPGHSRHYMWKRLQ
jgi:GNAT superfamily N-acetyltransferase